MSNKPSVNSEHNGDLAYWMGRVDNQLVTIQQTLAQLASNERSNWSEFKAWRSDVDNRLEDGSRNFVRIDNEVTHINGEIETIKRHMTSIQELQKDCRQEQLQYLRSISQPEKNKKGNGVLDREIAEGQNITYKWVLEKILLPVGVGFAAWFLLTVLPDLIKNNL